MFFQIIFETNTLIFFFYKNYYKYTKNIENLNHD